MKPRPFWEANSCEAGNCWRLQNVRCCYDNSDKIPCLLRNSKINLYVHKIMALVPILNKINPVCIRTPSTVILFYHLRPHIFPSDFPNKILYTFLISPMCAKFSICLLFLHLITLVIFEEIFCCLFTFSASRYFPHLKYKYSHKHQLKFFT